MSENTSEDWSHSTGYFNRPVSLGACCPVIGNLGRHFGIRYTCPLDWVLSPLSGVVNLLLDNDPARLFDPDDLTVEPAWNQRTVFNMRYRIYLSHLFPTDAQGHVVPDWRHQITAKRHIFERIWEYFLSLNSSDNHIVFFRMSHDLDLLRNGGTTPSDVERLIAVLKSRFDKADISLVMINYDELGASCSGIRGWGGVRLAFLHIEHEPKPDWLGPRDVWAEALESFGLQYRAT